MQDFQSVLELYDYKFPERLIAQAPASPRDSARLLVFDRKTGMSVDTVFRDIGKYLPKQSVLVLNETKVIPARLTLTRKTGGMVSILWLGKNGELIRVMANRKLHEGEILTLQNDEGFEVIRNIEKYWLLKPTFPIGKLQSLLEKKGSMPLPPYIKHTPLTEDELKREYQTVFAKEAGSIAAPTASLHFTEELLQELETSGIGIIRVTLHVHLGTFAPLTEEQWKQGILHTEEYYISDESRRALEEAKKQGRKIIAVGTTVVRTLESASDEQGSILHPKGSTNLFIRDVYLFRIIDGLVTNFHVPKSSLMMLVSAFTGREKLLELYHHAIEQEYTLFSFGDTMLIM